MANTPGQDFTPANIATPPRGEPIAQAEPAISIESNAAPRCTSPPTQNLASQAPSNNLPVKPTYDHDTVTLLFSTMKQAGYGDRKQQKKSLKDVFRDAVKIAEKSHDIKRTAKGWQKKFTRIKQEYSAFIAKLKQSGRDGDDEDLFNTPEYFEQMHELENGKARYDPPAQYSTDEGASAAELPSCSTRKRLKLSKESLLSEFIKRQEETTATLISALNKSNEEREKTRTILERFVDKF